MTTHLEYLRSEHESADVKALAAAFAVCSLSCTGYASIRSAGDSRRPRRPTVVAGEDENKDVES